MTGIEFIGEDADGPKVQFCIIGLFIEYFRAKVVDGATEGLAIFGGMYGPSEIGELDDVVIADEYVFRFEVAVYDVHAVQVLHRFYHLPHVDCCLSFGQCASIAQYFVELSSGRVLQDDVDSLLVEEEPVHSQHVLMPEVGMDLDLSSQLADDLLLDQLPFG